MTLNGSTNTQIPRRWRRPVRIIWPAIVVLLLALFFVCLPFHFAELQQLCAGTACPPMGLEASEAALLIAALFYPLRRRLQTFIDRRFYRQKYEAAQVLARFARTTRDEVELERLQEAVLGVIERTVAPASCSVWLAGTQTGHSSGARRTP